MFREVRRKDRLATEEDCLRILEEAEYGILATQGEDLYPYAIPINFVFLDGKIYMHSTRQRCHKLDYININPHVCFTVIGETEVLPDKFNTRYESVVIFGTAELIEDETLRQKALIGLIQKYSADYYDKGMQYIEKSGDRTAIIEVTPVHMTGKKKTK